MLIRGVYGVVYRTIIIGMFRYIIIIIYEVPTRFTLTGQSVYLTSHTVTTQTYSLQEDQEKL